MTIIPPPSYRFFYLEPDYLLISAMVRINLFLKGTLSPLAIDVNVDSISIALCVHLNVGPRMF
jgi:hypothetical protein